VGVAERLKAPGCGPGDRGFESLRSPFLIPDSYYELALVAQPEIEFQQVFCLTKRVGSAFMEADMSRPAFVAVVITIVCLLSVLLGGLAVMPSQVVVAAPGDSPSDPILISNISVLQNMNLNLSAHYALSNSIDASSTSGWNGGMGFLPIGNDSNRFNGSFDGRGFIITGLYINLPTTNNVGLFGAISATGSVRNISLITANITGNNNVGRLVGENSGCTVNNSSATGNVKGKNAVGGLIGWSCYGTVSNSYTTGTISGSDFVGGLVGWNCNGNSVSNSYATGAVSGISDVGGLVGENYNGSVTNSYATGAVSGISDVGGLVGENYNGTVNNSYTTGNTKGNESTVGGLAGRNYYGSVTNSYATGKVEGNDAVGGLVGESRYATVFNSYATGNVKGNGVAVGGLVGWNYNGGSVNNSYATGTVNGTSDIGGLVGRNDDGGLVNNSYSTGNVSGGERVGGLVGWNYDGGTVSNSFYDRNTAGQSDTLKGEPKTTAEMKDLATFTGWDMAEIGTNLNKGYPYLSWQLPDNSPVWYIYRAPCPAPETPRALYPVSVITDISVNVTLSWSECIDASYYNFYLGTEYPLYYDRTVNSSYNLSQLPYNTTFYWQVVAVNDCGSKWGPVWNFTTECAKPQTPSPGNNSTNSSTSVLLSWNASINASAYDVYLGTSAILTYHGSTNNSSYHLPLLNYSTRYYWQVAARNACGNTSSDIWNFATVYASRQIDADIMGAISSWAMDDDGALLLDINESSPDGNVNINISSGTVMLDNGRQPLVNLSVKAVYLLPNPSDGGYVLTAFDFQPDGATFAPGMQITLAYDPDAIPYGIDKNDLFIGLYNEETGEWQYLIGTVNAETHTVTFTVTHFTVFAVLALPEGIPNITLEPTPTEMPTPVDKGGKPAWLWIVLGIDSALTLVILASIFTIANRRSQGKRKASGTRLSGLFRIPRLRRAPIPPKSE
jgi:hypothetical protein